MVSRLEVVATNDEYSNDPENGCVIVNDKKLPAIYRDLREEVFVGPPIQENQGNNHIAFISRHGPNGNYGWQLFKTARGTAMLEYRGPVSFWGHEGSPLPIEQETGLREMQVTFYQDQEAIQIARGIVERYTKKREK